MKHARNKSAVNKAYSCTYCTDAARCSVLIQRATNEEDYLTSLNHQIILHCSATKAGQHFTVSDITRWHRERGFKTIGYHFVIHADGSIHKGRNLTETGTHATGQNTGSIGICYIGGLDAGGKVADTRTDAQKTSLVKLVAELKTKFPNVTVPGHYEFADKACPCFDVQKEFGA